MSRLADRIHAQGVLSPEGNSPRADAWMPLVLDALCAAPKIVVDNVADYYYGRMDSGSSAWRLEDFPNVAPPFEEWFMEFRRDGSELMLGALFKAHDITAHDVDTSMLVDGAQDARWILEAIFFISPRKQLPVELRGHIQFCVDPDGRPLRVAIQGERAPFLVRQKHIAWAADDPSDIAQQGAVLGRGIVYPMLLALSFMHCKNVSSALNEPPPKLARAHEKRHGHPLVKYYTLQIDPMREVLKREGGSEQHGLKKALHICRGHFAHYDDKPLFGKYTGTFWKPMHTRGQAKDRLVIKDYAVQPGRST